MILRSVKNHVRDQNWLAVRLDLLIVVVGVFIGIRAATRSFHFEDGDLVLDFTTPNGWRFYRRLQRMESCQSDD